jgi:hypothetical protein
MTPTTGYVDQMLLASAHRDAAGRHWKSSIGDALMPDANVLLTRIEAAEYLRRSPRGFDRLRLPRIVIDRRPLFLRADLDKFIQSKRTTPVTTPMPAVRSRRKAKLVPITGPDFNFETWLRRQKDELIK